MPRVSRSSWVRCSRHARVAALNLTGSWTMSQAIALARSRGRSAGGEHATNLAIGRVLLWEKHHAKLAHDSIEGAVWKRKRSGVGGPKVYRFARPELRPRHLKHWRVEVSRCHMHAGRQKIA